VWYVGRPRRKKDGWKEGSKERKKEGRKTGMSGWMDVCRW